MSDEKKSVELDWFSASVFGVKTELTLDAIDTLSMHAESYLKACGNVSWSEWRLLNIHSRQAFETAGERIDEFRIRKIVDQVVERMSEKILDQLLAKWQT